MFDQAGPHPFSPRDRSLRMCDRDSVTPLSREADIRVATSNRRIPITPTDQILGPFDSRSCLRFSPRLSGAGQAHHTPQRYPSAPDRTSGPRRSRRPRVHRTFRAPSANGILFLMFFCALPSPLLAAQQQIPPLPRDSTVPPPPSVSMVSSLEFARVAGQVDILSAQLTAQYEASAQTLDTINTIVTVYAALFSGLVLLLGFLGYRNIRSDLQRSLQSKIEEQLSDSVSDRLDEFLAEKERTWDQRFTELLRRVTRLSDPGS